MLEVLGLVHPDVVACFVAAVVVAVIDVDPGVVVDHRACLVVGLSYPALGFDSAVRHQVA